MKQYQKDIYLNSIRLNKEANDLLKKSNYFNKKKKKFKKITKKIYKNKKNNFKNHFTKQERNEYIEKVNFFKSIV